MSARDAEFPWRPVVGAWTVADLSRRVVGGRVVLEDPPVWPSKRYRELYYDVRRRLIAPASGQAMTLAELCDAADALIIELSHASSRAGTPERTVRLYERAAAGLLLAKSRAEQGRS